MLILGADKPFTSGSLGAPDTLVYRVLTHRCQRTSARLLPELRSRPKLPELKSSKLLIRLADWKNVAVRY